jgi:hypothetical protein
MAPPSWGLFGLGWLIVLVSTFLISHFELFGLAQSGAMPAGRRACPPQFRRPFFYRWSATRSTAAASRPANMPTSSSRRRRAITNCWCCAPTSRRLGDHRRHGRAARRLDRAGARQHHRRAARAAGGARRQCPSSSSTRNELPGSSAETVAELERLHAVGNRSRFTNISAPICRPSAARASTGRSARTRSRSASAPAMIMPCSSMPRTASPRPGGSRCRCSASPAASSASARPTSAAAQFAYASWSTCKTGEVVWFNVLQAGSQIAGIKFGDIRTPQGAAQMVERLLGRMKPGRDVRRAMEEPR